MNVDRHGYCVPHLPSIYKHKKQMELLEKKKLKKKKDAEQRKAEAKAKKVEDLEEDIQDLLDDNVNIFDEEASLTSSNYSQPGFWNNPSQNL